MNTLNRDGRLDSLKGFLILLVVLGHIIGECGVTSCDTNSYWGGVRLWIYLFHMPLFVLLSGYFSRRKNKARELFQSLKSIAVTLVVFQILSLLLLYFVRHEFSFEYLVRPYWTLWYLMSLLLWRIMLQFTPEKLLQRPILYLVITTIISIASGLVLPYGYVFAIQRALSFYPFFLLGYYMGQEWIKIPINKNTKVVALIVIISFSCMVFTGVWPNSTIKLLLGAYRFPFNQLPIKLLLFVCSIMMSLSFYVVFKESSGLAKIGRDSLFYYLYHGIIIQFILIPLFGYLKLPWNIITVIISFLCVVVALWLMSKSRLLYKLTKLL